MSITKNDPKTILLGGPYTEVNEYAASEAISPGHACELFNNAGVVRVRKSTKDGVKCALWIARDASMLNKGVADDYALADLVECFVPAPGCKFLVHIASGQTIVPGDYLEGSGNGLFEKLGAGVPLLMALEAETAVADTLLRVEAL